MAGWKLRKDKTQSESPESEAETSTAEHGAEVYSTSADGMDAPVQVGYALPPDLETGDHLRFQDEEGPLKLMDYSDPAAAPIIAAPPPAGSMPAAPPAPEMATLAKPSFDTSTAEPGDEAGDFTSTLRMSREELAAAFAPPPPTGIPVVAPFVLDAPLVSPATEETPPRLVVRMGRLSAAFDITKEVTIIGRPDSDLHYYPDVEIDLDDAVSRRHAEIIRRDGAYSIVDTGSTNGTLLNGETLLAHEEHPLAHGDRIRVGERTEIIFE